MIAQQTDPSMPAATGRRPCGRALVKRYADAIVSVGWW
jgi:hypothetical protein